MAAHPGEGAVLTLTAGACVLRAWWKSDAASLVQHANNRNVAQHLRDRFPHPYTRAHAVAFLSHAAGADVTTNFAIVVDDAAVGGIGYIRGSDVERFSAEVGYWLGEAYWGRGIMTEAGGRLTQHLWDEVKLLRAFALPLADNQGSIRIFEKAVPEREALLRASCVKYGQPGDQYLYARLNEAWRL